MQKEEIRAIAEAYVGDTDQFVVDVKLSPSRLAVFIDKPSGITLDECASLSRYLIDRLESTGFLEKHEIEVSSPGMDMPLLVPQQYLRRIGNELRVIMADGKELKGILHAAGDDYFELLSITEKKENKKKVRTEELVNINYNDVRETKLIFNFKLK